MDLALNDLQWLICHKTKPNPILLFKHFFIKIQPNMREQEKNRQRIYDLLNAETKPKNFWNNWSFFMASIKPRP